MVDLFRRAKLSKLKIFILLLFTTFQVLGTLYIPTLTADILNYGVAQGNEDEVLRIGQRMLIVAIGTGIFSIMATYFSADISTLFAKKIRQKLFDHTQKLSVQDFKHFKTSSLITRSTNDIEQMQSMLTMFFEMLVPLPFVVVIGMFLAYTRHPQMALIILITVLLFTMVIVLLSKKVIPLFKQVQVGLDKINDKVGQYISGIRVIRAFNRTELEQGQMDNAFNDFAKLNIRINRLFAMMMPLIMLFLNFSTVSILWFGAHRINVGDMQIGDIAAVIEYAMNILFYSVMAVFALTLLPRALECSRRVKEVLDYKPEIYDGKSTLAHSDSKLSLEFRNVSFCYADAENPVLHDLNFVCEAGKTTAIIGGTGSGKSTIAKLIPRLYEVQGGEILLNNMNLNELPQHEVREKMGFVPQKTFLFSGTIADNLRHGKKDATTEEMNNAVKVAQAEKFINDLEHGLESNVAQGGRNFSGGQRQRLSIARMLIKKPDIYVFDDSFSALDFKTDANLRSALKAETKNSIVIYVAQRISTIKDADQIIVLEEGRVVGKGTHRELLSSCDIYLQIAKSQLSEEELA